MKRQEQRDQRRRHHHAQGRARVHDAHGRGALLDGEPFRDHARGGGEAAAFARPQQQPAGGQHAEARGQGVAGAGQRPEHHDDREAPARAQGVQQPAARRVHERVGDEERRLQERELLVGDGDLPLDGLDGDGQRLPVQVADGDGRADEDGDPPAQGGTGLGSRRGSGRAHHSSTTSETAWRGSASGSVAWPPSMRTVAGASSCGELARGLELRVLLRVGRDRRAHALPGRERVAVRLVDAVVACRRASPLASGSPLTVERRRRRPGPGTSSSW